MGCDGTFGAAIGTGMAPLVFLCRRQPSGKCAFVLGYRTPVHPSQDANLSRILANLHNWAPKFSFPSLGFALVISPTVVLLPSASALRVCLSLLSPAWPKCRSLPYVRFPVALIPSVYPVVFFKVIDSHQAVALTDPRPQPHHPFSSLKPASRPLKTAESLGLVAAVPFVGFPSSDMIL